MGKVTLARDDLLRATTALKGALYRFRDGGSSVASSYRIEAKRTRITIAASDGRDFATIELQGEVHRCGACFIDGMDLLAQLRTIDRGSSIIIERIKDKVALLAGRFTARMPAIDGTDFVEPEPFEAMARFAISTDDARALLLNNLSIVSRCEETRYYLHGVHLKMGSGKVIAAATDGHRLAKVVRAVVAATANVQCILPRTAIGLLKAMQRCDSTETLRIRIGATHASVSADRFRIVTKLIDGTFPDYEKVIPAEFNSSIRLSLPALLGASARVCATDRKSPLVKIQTNGSSLAVTRSGLDIFASEEIEAVIEGEPVTAGFNAGYLRDFRPHLASDEMTLSVVDPATAIRLSGPAPSEDVFILMPCRV